MGRIYQEPKLAPLGSLYSDFQTALAHSFLGTFSKKKMKFSEHFENCENILKIFADFQKYF